MKATKFPVCITSARSRMKFAEHYDGPVKCYKIVEFNDGGPIKTLFHGVNGTRIIPLDRWILSDRKWAGEGGRKYWTGFHVILTKQDALEYIKLFTSKKKKRAIIQVMAKGLRKKESSKHNVYLADSMLVRTFNAV